MKRKSWTGWIVPRKGDIFHNITPIEYGGGWYAKVYESWLKASKAAKADKRRVYKVRVSVVPA